MGLEKNMRQNQIFDDIDYNKGFKTSREYRTEPFKEIF